MADDGSAKRLKTALEDGAVVVDMRRRNAPLDSEVQRLRSENEQLRRRNMQLEGNHEVLPVVVAPFVDLSRVDTSIVAHITSFLGESRELLNLALTCKSFGQPASTSTLSLSLVEEVARRAVCSRATDAETSCLPRYASGTTTWLSILNRFERHRQLLVFDVLLGRYIEHRNGDRTAVCGTRDDGDDVLKSTSVASGYVMTSGVHFAEFKVTGFASIGIVRPMPGLDAGSHDEFCFIHGRELYSDFLAQRSDDWGGSDVHVCEYNACVYEGSLSWTDWGNNEGSFGEPDGDENSFDGTIPVLLNLDEGTLTVYSPDPDSPTVVKDGLSGPYCWYASVDDLRSTAVAIKRGTPRSQMGDVA